ncbi:MAG TPA: OmpA family protein [Sumerlaeia bacterium]|nr:OmpA family protein [Sumerlaeia bacterium]
MARKKAPEKGPSHERWLVSYADFITLLFAVFVVMFATSNNSDKGKREQYSQGFRAAFDSPLMIFPGLASSRPNPLPDTQVGLDPFTVVTVKVDDGSPLTPVSPTPLVKEPPEDDSEEDWDSPGDTFEGALDTPSSSTAPVEPLVDRGPKVRDPNPIFHEGEEQLREVFVSLKEQLEKELAQGVVEMSKEERGIIITLGEAGFFDSGSASLKYKSLETIDRIAKKLYPFMQKGMAVRIEGHTDTVPVAVSRAFRNNMELSTARANSVWLRLVTYHEFPGGRLSTSGYGEYHPIAPNDTEEGRARNRRVDLVILTSTSSKLEPQA